MIKNDQREVLSFGSSQGCYLSLGQIYLEVACEVLNLSKKDNEVSMNYYMLYDACMIMLMIFILCLCCLSIIIMSIVDDSFKISYVWYDSFHT